jgi:PAS domain S-box-containing protein
MASELKNILLVEDDSLIATTETFWLEKAGYKVFHVSTGEKAIQTVKENPGKINLILMDIDLGPGLDGTRAAQEILVENDIPILFLSAHTEKEIVNKTEKITSFGYIVKDSTNTVFLASIKMAFKLYEAYSAIKEKENKLMESEKRFFSLFQSMTEGVALHELVFDDKGNAIDYKIIDANPAYEVLTGISIDKAVGTPASILYRTGVPPYINEYSEVERTGKPKSFCVQFEPMNKYFLISVFSPSIGQFATVFEDITKRKEAEVQLAKTNAELENYFKVAIDLLCIANTDGYFIHLNPEWERLLGYSIEELLSIKFLDLVHPDDLTDTLNAVGELSSQHEVINFTNRYKCKDGSYKYIEWRSHPDGNLIYAAARDITERKNLEKALRESEAKYRILLEESHDPIFIIAADGTYQYVNKAFAKGVNLEPTEIINKKIWDIFPPQHATQRFNAVKSVIATGETKVIEVKVEANSETKYYVTTVQPIKNDVGDIPLVMCSSKDITDRKKMEESYKASEERLAQFFLSNPDALSINRVDNGKFIEINPGFTNLFGYSPQEIKGHTSSEDDLNLWANAEERETFYKEVQDTGEISNKEIVCRKKDGTFFNGLISAKNFVYDGDVYRLTTNRDITRQKELEKLLKRSAEEKELMLRELQHRIKNNLNVLSGLLSIASESLTDEKSQSVFSDALSRIKTMSTIYQHLYKSPEFDSINLKVYLHELSETLFNTYNIDKEKVKLVSKLVDIRLDAKRTESLGLILNELISNSLKYAFKDKHEGIVELQLEKSDGKIKLIIRDNGNGLPDDFCIENTDSLGMKLVKLLTMQINGTLNIENRNGVFVEISFTE